MDNDSRGQTSKQIARILLVTVLVSLVLFLMEMDPETAKPIVGGVIVLGIFVLVIAGVLIREYRYIKDDEPTTLFGKPTYGKRVRDLLFNTGVGGLTLILAGFFIWFAAEFWR
jgi:hypothetical protein